MIWKCQQDLNYHVNTQVLKNECRFYYAFKKRHLKHHNRRLFIAQTKINIKIKFINVINNM